MITESNFRDLLLSIGFQKNGDLFEKTSPHFAVSMSVDFSKKKLIYPGAIKGRERNNGFDHPENFVVFECVNRLLEKGYRPEHIELEKEWRLGHDAKSGRADIRVTDEDGKTLFIIECKTWGREFDKALSDTKNDGAQLFSYWQQEQSCEWLVLYASEFKDGAVSYKDPTIGCSDDANILLLAKKDKSIKLYRDTHTAPEKYEVWKKTYGCQLHDDLVFSADSVAYQIGVKPLLKKNLRDFTPDDKIVNKFEEILRHNNVSDKENAFNRLVALFICKLVDESTKSEDDEVEFQYKQGTDTYETLQDRLQRLHRDGMEKFMREKIFYVPADYPERLFSTYTGSKRKQAIEDLQNTIRILKFYSNNDFTFQDVHNEELFYQNGKILVEMVQLFEKYRIVYPSKHQFLGDLFEQLLNKGFKQNEGQFFTPIPITRFVWDSLPVDRMVKSERGTVYPKVIDYACGAGHFLTEAIEAINYFAQTGGDNAWVRDHIFGIEKDYRLARVAKISLFMNGAGEGNIIFGDGLENAPDKGIDNGSFDILVANPPYSVKDFKQHLQLKSNSFSLLDRIGVNGGEIETLFVERIGQLLKPQGIAAVILPSSILSNDSASYTGAREQLLRNFYIRAIAAFGSKTFGATGTNTVIMFLEKFNEPPKASDLSMDSVDAIFNGKDLDEWTDQEILEAYAAQIGVEKDVYRVFLNSNYTLQELSDIEYFKMYVGAFADSADAKNLQKTKAYQNESAENQAAAYLKKFYAYAHAIEKEKLFYFSLVYRQTTVVITAPADNKEQKDFLGYDWSNRKGSEGIQIIAPGGKMYDNSDRTAEGTLAGAIRKSFNGTIPSFTEEQQVWGSVISTKDMLDFSRVSFNKSLRLSMKKKFTIKSKYDLRRLDSVCKINVSKAEVSDLPDDVLVSFVEMASVSNEGYISNKVDRAIGEVRRGGYTYFAENDIIIAKITPCMENGKCAIATGLTNGVGFGSSEFHVFRCDNAIILTDYLFKLLNSKLIRNAAEQAMTGASGHRRVPEAFYAELQIPVPPLKIQRQIAEESRKVDEEYNATRASIGVYHKKIEELFEELDIITKQREGYRLTLSAHDDFDVSIGKRVLNHQLLPDGAIPVYSANVNEPFGYIDERLITDFSVPSVLWGIDGDWMTNYVPEDFAFYPTDHCGVLRCKTPKVNPRYMAHILETEGRKRGFSRSYRASIDRVRGITFAVPDRAVQDETIAKIEEIEAQIRQAESKLKILTDKTADILAQYLN